MTNMLHSGQRQGAFARLRLSVLLTLVPSYPRAQVCERQRSALPSALHRIPSFLVLKSCTRN